MNKQKIVRKGISDRKLRRLGRHLRTRRRELDMTLAQVGERVGLSAVTIHKYEAGTIEPPWLRLLALAKALRLDVRSLADVTRGAASRSA